jgi:hypothetical protein
VNHQPKPILKRVLNKKKPIKPQPLATKVGDFLLWTEVFGSLGFWLWFLIMVFSLKTPCINSVCRNTLLIDGNLYNTVLRYILPLLSLIGIVRVGFDFFVNHKSQGWGFSFYLGLVGLHLSYLLFGLESRQFLFFYDKNEVLTDSVYITWELVFLVCTSFVLFRTKIVWDKSTFFIKTRAMYYFLHIVLMLTNINLGLLSLLFFIPFLIYIDLSRRSLS